ncbi:hypothetical protein A3L04_08855 [Thermococcus chitonophagus]|uniref:Uncharacterized protein n=1 Tax=Thermococcus chitonophagus TaxID=54262 RepID=A0A160VS17_9EURY|nr:hypothetical protein [Thermococcus chitonophagus]ASJ17169.1 hypothetical protein A3L04_08855 [Thermococcus chitonophagus]CUX77777.1 hypothetical protein CHITON_0998 [Thermococcus chitonophagus]
MLEYKKFKVAHGDEKVKIAKEILKRLIELAHAEPYWEVVERTLGLREGEAKGVLIFLENMGELKIRRAKNGRKLYVLTLRERRKNPQTLDMWLKVSKIV